MTTHIKIIDSHIHLYDNKANQHSFLDEFDPNYAAFVGDYSAMPRKYLLENYLKDSADYQVDGIVWHEFLSADPIREAQWAQDLAKQSNVRQAMVVLVDFLDPTLEEKLEIYNTLQNVTAVREHMVWDNDDPRKRFAKRPDLLTDLAWQKRLRILNKYRFKCGLVKKAGLFSEQGIILGKIFGKTLCLDGYEHVTLFAPTGLGKTVTLTIINLLYWKDSAVVNDIKLTLFEHTSKYRQDMGQKVFLWNPASPKGITHC